MKKIIIGLALFYFLPAYPQNDLIQMNWGFSSDQLKEAFPETNWKRQVSRDLIGYTTPYSLEGLDAKITYFFVDDQLSMVSYLFTNEHVYNNVYYDDFLRISALLNKHYAMEREDRWKDTSLKDDLRRIGYAVLKGDVVIEEKYEDSKITIIHTLFSDELFRHALVFASQEYVNTMKSKNNKTN